jgi:NTE family protein
MLVELATTVERPDFIVGVSAGALNGAFLAFDPSQAMVDHMASLWSRVSTREALGLSWRSVLGLVGMRGFLADAAGMRRILETELPYRSFDQARVPLHVVATHFASGSDVVLSTGAIIPAVLASAAIPGVFPPVEIDGQELVDGVVAVRTPIAVARRLGASRIVVLPSGFTCVSSAVPRNVFGRAMHAVGLLGARQLRADFERYAGEAQLYVVPPPCPLNQSPYDYSQGAALIATAREYTRRWLDAGGLGRPGFPNELIIHSHD